MWNQPWGAWERLKPPWLVGQQAASFASVPSISDLASLDTASDTQWLTIGKNARSGGIITRNSWELLWGVFSMLVRSKKLYSTWNSWKCELMIKFSILYYTCIKVLSKIYRRSKYTFRSFSVARLVSLLGGSWAPVRKYVFEKEENYKISISKCYWSCT